MLDVRARENGERRGLAQSERVSLKTTTILMPSAHFGGIDEDKCRTDDGYGLDRYSDEARLLIKDACRPERRRTFPRWRDTGQFYRRRRCSEAMAGVLSAETGHVNVHEAVRSKRPGIKSCCRIAGRSFVGGLNRSILPIVSRRPDGRAYGAAWDDLSLSDNGAWNGLPPK